MSKRKYEVETKLKIIKEYEAGGISVYQLAKKYGIDTKSIHSWYRNYKTFGKEVFTGNHANINYTANFKKVVVLYYLQGGRSYQEVTLKFGIYAPTTVIQWVKQYNNHEELTISRPREMYYGKKYHSWEELIQGIERYMDYYTNKRPQRKLGVLTPKEYHRKLLLVA